MHFGIVAETSPLEHRVPLTPYGVEELVAKGHTVTVEKGAGVRAQFSDEDFQRCGAIIAYNSDEAWIRPDMVLRFRAPAEEDVRSTRAPLARWAELRGSSAAFLDGKEHHMDKMLVVAFSTESAAYEGSRALSTLDSDGAIVLYAKAVIAKDAAGRVALPRLRDPRVQRAGLGVSSSFLSPARNRTRSLPFRHRGHR